MAKDSQPIDAAALVSAFVASPDDALVKGNTVNAVTSLSDSTRDRQVNAGTFPAPLKFGTRCKRLTVRSVRGWLAAQSAGCGQWAPSTQTADAARKLSAAAEPVVNAPPKRGPGRPRKDAAAQVAA